MKSMKFWNWIEGQDTDSGRVLRMDGAIAEETWFGDEVTPALFKKELLSGGGDITLWINSPGGDVFAAAQIYTMLKEYPGRVTVKIDGMAASAASVIAMAGTEVLLSPVSYLVIHNPATVAVGDRDEMLCAKAMLDEIKEGIINAYENKTQLSREKISKMMDAESFMNAKKAVELGFADGILYAEGGEPKATDETLILSRAAVTNSLISKLPVKAAEPKHETVSVRQKRLNLIRNQNQ